MNDDVAHLVPGAHCGGDGTTFVVLTTSAKDVALRLFDESGAATRTVPLESVAAGQFRTHLRDVHAGALYKLVLDGHERPDPYARFLPDGVHGAARVIPRASEPGLATAAPAAAWIIYELHVGTFSPEGTYRGAEAKLDALADVGVTAIELLPLASFAGERGWGYDGVALYAPHAAYGEPEELRSFVRAAHARGIAVLLDVVYNHFGPAGNYLPGFAPEYFTTEVETPWGAAPDFGHAPMRELALDNARYWLEEFGFDGLRLDATHAIHDRSPKHVLRDITDLAHAMTPPRRVFFEDERNDPAVVTNLGADGVWADDFHHHVHVLLTGERDGYYAAYEPTVVALAGVINGGWTYTGQAFSPWQNKPRGKPVRESGVKPEQLLYCLQNHDQIGNRALGTRVTAHADLDAFCAASMLLLFVPATPLLFMGQEWASSTPFLFFSDHDGDLADAVRNGRRDEFKSFAAFADPAARAAIPDPQARTTFESSKLAWDERQQGDHGRVLALYRAMIALRRNDYVLSAPCDWIDVEAAAHGEVLEVVRRHGAASRRLLVNFGTTPHAIAQKWRLLQHTGSLEGATLGPKSAALFAND